MFCFLVYFHASNMKRRQAIRLGIGLLGAGTLATLGVKLGSRFLPPDLGNLDRERELLKALVDAIIPATDTPSASACGVHEFVIKMVKVSLDNKSQNNFLNGLVELNEASITNAGKPFAECQPAIQETILNGFAVDLNGNQTLRKVKEKIFGRDFYLTLREFTVVGYFTSQVGATQALRYSLVPVKYEPCLPYANGEKAWATF